MVRRLLPAPPDLAHQVGAGGRAGHRTVDGAPAGAVQPRLRQQPVPRPAAVLQVVGRRGRTPRPMARLHPPKVTDKLVPVFTSGELSALEKACAGRGFAQRRDAAIIAVFRATGIRLAELAAIRYDPHDTQLATSTCGSGRSRCGPKPGSPASSGSATRPPRPWTATYGSGPARPGVAGRDHGDPRPVR